MESLRTSSGSAAHANRIERIEQELQDAQEMQRSILPSEDPEFAGLEISSYLRPATEIGGDYYDLIPLSETKLAVAIGDVKGHGMSAGLMVSTASGCLHTTLETTLSVTDVMRVMNRRICEVKGRNFMTFCFSIIDIASRQISVGSAGHPFPYHYSHAEQRLLTWDIESDWPLGVRENHKCRNYPRTLERGDILVYFSDGIVDGSNDEMEPFGFDRLESAIVHNASLPALDMKRAILNSFFAHCGQKEPEDDITLIVIRVICR
jgi:sigma-B regulation protein RsbU (phosphoserine phosphatase)